MNKISVSDLRIAAKCLSQLGSDDGFGPADAKSLNRVLDWIEAEVEAGTVKAVSRKSLRPRAQKRQYLARYRRFQEALVVFFDDILPAIAVSAGCAGVGVVFFLLLSMVSRS